MFIVFEVSRPFQPIPRFTRLPGITIFRVMWLFFAFSVHPMRYDEMISLANSWDIIVRKTQ